MKNTEIFTPEEAKHHHHVKSLLDVMADLAMNTGGRRTIFDFGCGDAWYINNLAQTMPDRHFVGVEGSRNPATLFEWETMNNVDVVQWDLRNPFLHGLGERGTVFCIEVMEHIHAEYHDTVMDTLSRHCTHTLLLSWAVPGQGGTRHVSERSAEQVIPYVGKWGFTYQKERSEAIRKDVGAECGYMRNSIYLFTR